MVKKLLTAQDKIDVLNTLDGLLNGMSRDERKAVLNKIGIAKVDIEALDDNGLIAKVKTEYSNVIDKLDLNNVDYDSITLSKYKVANEFMSRKKPTELKEEIEKYKNL